MPSLSEHDRYDYFFEFLILNLPILIYRITEEEEKEEEVFV